jgi:hypothetical protein
MIVLQSQIPLAIMFARVWTYSGCRLGEIGGVGVNPPRRGRLFVGEQPPCTPVAY